MLSNNNTLTKYPTDYSTNQSTQDKILHLQGIMKCTFLTDSEVRTVCTVLCLQCETWSTYKGTPTLYTCEAIALTAILSLEAYPLHT